MPNINFPANPVQGQEYVFNNFKYIFNGNRWQSARNDSSSDLDYFKKDLSAPGSKVVIAGMEAKDFIDQKDGIPATAVMWFPSRDANHEGFIPADGQLLSRGLYPSLWKAIEDGKVPVVTDSSWTDNVDTRGSYTTGDGSTTFRVPDYNGKTSGSKGSAFLRGDGLNAGEIGHIQGDAIRDIQGHIGSVGGSLNRSYGVGFEDSDGVFHRINQDGFDMGPIAATQARNADLGNIEFRASRVVPTADENRPTNVAGVWMIKAFSYVENEGVVDAAHLATALADAEAKIAASEVKIAALESRRITQVVEVLWEGNVGQPNITLTLNSPLVGGDLITLIHTDSANSMGPPLTVAPSKLVNGQYLQFSFGPSGQTVLRFVDSTHLVTDKFTSGYGIKQIIRTRHVLV
ncbi:MAG: phage tail protein [Bacteroidales bacterium]